MQVYIQAVNLVNIPQKVIFPWTLVTNFPFFLSILISKKGFSCFSVSIENVILEY